MGRPTRWTKGFFRAPVFDPGEAAALRQAPPEAAFAARALGLKKGQRVLDLCCGAGRHSFELARRGLSVVGIDATPEYLAAARRRLGSAANPVFVRGDMRRLEFRAEFDAALNLWTSFGYFEDPRDDLRVLKGVRRALKPGGRFLVDLVSAEWNRLHAPERNWRRREDGALVLEEIVQREGRDPGLTNTWTVIPPRGKPRRARFFVRSYDFPRLKDFLERSGFRVVRRWGGLENVPFVPGKSRRLVVLARRS